MKRILVVDDDDNLRQLVAATLAQAGYQVEEARNGQECVECARRGFRGVILMDVVMPVMDGWEAIRNLAAEDLLEGSAVVMLTGLVSPGEDADGLQELVLDYLTKPFGASSLRKVVESATLALQP